MADNGGAGRKLKEAVDDVMNRVLRSTEDLKGELKPIRENLRKEVKAAARDLKRLMDQGLETIEAMRRDREIRPVAVMTRLSNDDAKLVDTLVRAGLFESRSEAVAYLTHIGLEERSSLLSRVKDTANKIQTLREELRRELQ
jgi:Arc/MetJ-type ribon-helix-helix transcriptional regulator